MSEVIVLTDKKFNEIAQVGSVRIRPTGISKHVFVVAERYGRLLMNNGLILKSETIELAEKEFNK